MKIEYYSDDVKKKYKSVEKEHSTVSTVVQTLKALSKFFENNSNNIEICDVINESFGSLVIINFENSIIQIYVNYLEKKIILSSDKLPYKILYDDYPRKCFVPLGYLYEGEKRNVFNTNLSRLNQISKNTLILKITEKNKDDEYNVVLEMDDVYFDRSVFINEIITSDDVIDNIKDLLLLISSLINLKSCKIKITDKNNNLISYDHGILKDYVEYRDLGYEKQRIYKENNRLYVERTIVEECHDDTREFIKKIGAYNGKEKR